MRIKSALRNVILILANILTAISASARLVDFRFSPILPGKLNDPT